MKKSLGPSSLGLSESAEFFMFNNFSLFNEAKQNFTITHEYLQSYRPSNHMGKGPNLQLFCIFWSLTADISMWNFQGLKRCWSSVKKCKQICFKPTPSVTVCARVWGDACIMFLIHPDVLQDAITLKTFRMWRLHQTCWTYRTLLFSVKPTHGLTDCSSLTICSVTNTFGWSIASRRVWIGGTLSEKQQVSADETLLS